MAKYKVVLEQAEEGGFVVTCPAVPGTVSQGDTYEEAVANIKEALALALECYREDGVALPEDVDVTVEEVEVAS
ncbi:MAG: type II toxin-antitoxin system HicB family antitoxin [candidate division Zixibacteria bacterium]|nr:type II toxin-antitoxin system HicB family antitoxin [candidate division Zixibacteria bacterium]